VIVGGFVIAGESPTASFERARDAVLAMARRVIAGQPAGVPRHIAIALVAIADIGEETERQVLETLAASPDTEAA
jgi:hypothetical protein